MSYSVSIQVIRLKSRTAVLELAKEKTVKPREIFTGLNIFLAKEGEVNTVKKTNLDRQVQRLRAGTCKLFNPETFEEVCSTLPEHLKLTSEGSRFVAFCGIVEEDGATQDEDSEVEEEEEEQGKDVANPQHNRKTQKKNAVAGTNKSSAGARTENGIRPTSKSQGCTGAQGSKKSSAGARTENVVRPTSKSQGCTVAQGSKKTSAGAVTEGIVCPAPKSQVLTEAKGSKKSSAVAGTEAQSGKKRNQAEADPQGPKKSKKGPAGLIVLVSQHGIDRLSIAKLWMADGNAKIAKDPFSQIYIVFASAPSGRCLPSAWVFMTHRTAVCYKKMYQVLQHEVGNVKPAKIILDMEIAAYKAWLSVFHSDGNKTAITFCLFHWRTALLDKLKKLHCRDEFFKKGPKQKLFSRLSTLPFVPAEHVIDVAEDLLATFISDHLENLSEEGCDFLNYFRKTYVGTYDDKRDVRKPPRYPPHLWSIYSAFLNSEPYTTNYAEVMLIYEVANGQL